MIWDNPNKKGLSQIQGKRNKGKIGHGTVPIYRGAFVKKCYYKSPTQLHHVPNNVIYLIKISVIYKITISDSFYFTYSFSLVKKRIFQIFSVSLYKNSNFGFLLICLTNFATIFGTLALCRPLGLTTIEQAIIKPVFDMFTALDQAMIAWFSLRIRYQTVFFVGLGGGKVPKLGDVSNICYALQTPKPNPPPPNVQIYSPNLFLNYYIFILFYFISLALTKLDFLERPA